MTRPAAVAVVLLAACAASTPREDRTPARRPESTLSGRTLAEIEAARDEIRRLESLLSAAEVQATAPDCARIAQLRDNICALAARICELARSEPTESPTYADVLMSCSDGEARCKKAMERTRARGCPTK